AKPKAWGTIDSTPLGELIQLIEQLNNRSMKNAGADLLRRQKSSAGVYALKDVVDAAQVVARSVLFYDGRVDNRVIEPPAVRLGQVLVGLVLKTRLDLLEPEYALGLGPNAIVEV